MPSGWRKNAKYFNTDVSHNEYNKKKNEFRDWKKSLNKFVDSKQLFTKEDTQPYYNNNWT